MTNLFRKCFGRGAGRLSPAFRVPRAETAFLFIATFEPNLFSIISCAFIKAHSRPATSLPVSQVFLVSRLGIGFIVISTNFVELGASFFCGGQLDLAFVFAGFRRRGFGRLPCRGLGD